MQYHRNTSDFRKKGVDFSKMTAYKQEIQVKQHFTNLSGFDIMLNFDSAH